MRIKKMARLLIVLISIFIVSCTTHDDNLTKDEIDKIEKEVLASFDRFENSLTRGELETISKYYSDDSRFYWVENGKITYSSGAVARQAITDFYPSLKSMSFKSLDKKVTPINNSFAMLYVEYEQALVFPSDHQIEINGAMTILLKRKNADWEFITGHSSGKNENQG